MKIPIKKLKSGFEISVFALGTWGMGGGKEKISNYNPKKDIQAIQKAYELGVTRFDTAASYAERESEKILGVAVKDLSRKNIFITTKVPRPLLRYDDVLRSMESSLKRLNMDYVDLCLVHAPSHDGVPITEIMRAFDRLVEEGIAKNIGVSNFSHESFRKAQAAAHNKLVINQVHYNLIFREPTVTGLLDFCQKNDVFLEAWRPLQQGSLAKSGINLLDEMCRKYSKTPSQAALNWLVSQKNVITLSKSSNLNHLKDNLGAFDWEMEAEDVKKLSQEFPVQLNQSNVCRLE